MLTPRGFEIKGAKQHRGGIDWRRRRRRRRVRGTLLLVLLLAVAGAAWATWAQDALPHAWPSSWSLHRGSHQPAVAPAAPTRAAAPSPSPSPACPSPRAVTLVVLNATPRGGLAATVGTELKGRGYRVAKVGNAPTGTAVAGVAQVRHGTKGVAAARRVHTLVPGATDVLDTRRDARVELVLGSRFVRLAPAVAATAAC
ncbi:LytR C-terminal domain-containing protein [Motilibacter rhizosphaerae]|nr:LytR C-terminal domain-containing protein [Motilibacter rhizosphaerae]